MKRSLFVRVPLPDGGPVADHQIDHLFTPHAGSNQQRCLMSRVLTLQSLLSLRTVEDRFYRSHCSRPSRQVERSLSLSVDLQDLFFVSHQRLDQVNILPHSGQVEGGVSLLVLLLVLDASLLQ